MKRKVKQSWERNVFFVGIIIWGGLLSLIPMFFSAEEIPNNMGLGFLAILVFTIYTVIGLALIVRSADKDEKQKAEETKKLLKELKIKYASYISLVDEEIANLLEKITPEVLHLEMVSVSTSLNYLKTFDRYQKYVCTYKIVGTPDTFLVASCLMWALIKNHIIIYNNSIEQEVINIKLAMQCALKLISKPSTYYENEEGKWIEEKHPEVKIVIPEGLIKNSDLSLRMQLSFMSTNTYGKTIPIMQTSDMLHLLYLYCQKGTIYLTKKEDKK